MELIKSAEMYDELPLWSAPFGLEWFIFFGMGAFPDVFAYRLDDSPRYRRIYR
jgi:hypothetical protein